jgi:flavin reductase (DIM6/NTAB) family NADH-FMN oxidoreductase RutF
MVNADTEKAFGKIALHFDVPMIIVTTAFGEQRAGCLVGFSTHCSVHPPRFLMCSSEKNFTYSVLQNATHMAVHFISQEHMQLAELFGGTSGHSNDKFAQCKWTPHAETGVPILDGVRQWFVGHIIERHKPGDHMLLITEPVDAKYEELESDPIRFLQVRHLEPGHEP